MVQAVLGITAAIIAAWAAVIYVRDTLKGPTRPHRVSWGIWAVIAVLGAGSALEGGARFGAAVSLVYVGLTVVVFILSLAPKYGKPGGEWYDWPLGLVAAATIVAWQMFELPVSIAAVVAVAADSAAAWPTLRESWRQPRSEPLRVWAADAVASAMALVAVAKPSFAALAFPVYLFVAQSLIAGTLYARRKAADMHTEEDRG